MKHLGIFTAFAAAATLMSATVFAADSANNMEKCKVVKDGKGLIKEHKADCKASTHDCSGQNKAGDAESWINVPKGQCDKINAGDYSGLSKEMKDKLDVK